MAEDQESYFVIRSMAAPDLVIDASQFLIRLQPYQNINQQLWCWVSTDLDGSAYLRNKHHETMLLTKFCSNLILNEEDQSDPHCPQRWMKLDGCIVSSSGGLVIDVLNETRLRPDSILILYAKTPSTQRFIFEEPRSLFNPNNPNPNDPNPIDPNPNDPNLNDPNSDDLNPIDPNPNDPNPNDPNPDDLNPIDPNPNDPNPNDVNPNEPNPIDPNPNDPNPNDPNPDDLDPIDPNPNDANPNNQNPNDPNPNNQN